MISSVVCVGEERDLRVRKDKMQDVYLVEDLAAAFSDSAFVHPPGTPTVYSSPDDASAHTNTDALLDKAK